jgi:hypothetical protein
MGTALVLIGLAVADFFRAFADPAFDAMPTKFWMFVLALPFLVLGGVFLNLGFSGAAAGYMATEYSPAIRRVAGDLGLRDQAGPGPSAGAGPYCRSCGRRNDQEARFCDGCGNPMGA